MWWIKKEGDEVVIAGGDSPKSDLFMPLASKVKGKFQLHFPIDDEDENSAFRLLTEAERDEPDFDWRPTKKEGR